MFFCPKDGFVTINHQGGLVSATLLWKTKSEFYVYKVYRMGRILLINSQRS